MILSQLTLVFLFLCFPVMFTAGSHDNQTHFTGDVSINCGSEGNSAAQDGREWIGDIQPKLSSLLQLKGSSAASNAIHKLTIADPVPHKTARISDSCFSYAFRVSPGQKIIRLHFHPAPYKGFKSFRDFFTVQAGPFTLLCNFSASLAADALGVSSITKEFCISIEENQTLSISFSPVSSSQSADITYAFINGIEIISVPMHLSYFRGGDHRPQVVGQKSQVFIDNNTALELIHQKNVKRDSALPTEEFDDMLGRWGAFSKPKKNNTSLTWRTPVDVGFRYLVRIHFHDIRLQPAESGSVIFKVLINEMIVDTNTYIMKEWENHGFLWYRDYVVVMKGQKEEGKRDILISLQSFDEFMDTHKLIKGFQIFKMSNPDNSLASPNALPPMRESPSWVIQKLQPVFRHGNATVAISILSLINIIVYMAWEIWEESTMKEETRQTARNGRLCQHFSLAEIHLATKNFSEALVIGNGGFGKVYKGLIDNGRQAVAVKRLKSNSKQGKQEFLTEIGILSELRHINLVSLIGYCNDHREMILVYEYMPNGTLADHLHQLARGANNSSALTWKQLLDICIGAGRGLDYLHTGNGVIHRDVKASNILLDENLIAKVSDFGLAKPEDRSRLHTVVNGRDQDNIILYRDYMVVMRGRKRNNRRDILIDELADGHGVLAGFEIVKLSNPDDSLASPNPLPPPQDSQSHTFQYLLSFLTHPNASGTVAITVISLLCIIVHKLREVWEGCSTEEEHKLSANAERHCRRFPLAEIQLATKNFNEGLVIGSGGFGKVYKGLIDNGQKTVALKRLRSNSTQGAREFLTEIETLSELRHMNLVSLIGYCRERREMILVYEYMSCGTLADHLYKLGSDSCYPLNWKQRLSICIGAARGLDYLHTGHGIIHRDVKASNILLDESFMAKVSDFGLARTEDRSMLQSHVITLVKGTRGYFDSYYIKTGKLTRKSDIFAFGVVLLEVLCGRKALDLGVLEEERLLSYWALDKINKGEVDEIVASNLREEISPNSLKSFVEVAVRCLHDEPKYRPTMSQIVLQLESALELQESNQNFVSSETASISDDISPTPSDGVVQSGTSQPKMVTTDVQNIGLTSNQQMHNNVVCADLTSGEKHRRKPIRNKQWKLWPWDTLWNQVKPSNVAVAANQPSDLCRCFSLREIKKATGGLKDCFLIGKGAYGSVYKGLIDYGATTVAIKRLTHLPDQVASEFNAEFRILSELRHRHLVSGTWYH